jgi:hypothetical protein
MSQVARNLSDPEEGFLTGKRYKPGPLHRFLAEIPAPQVIVVTNYDTLVEQALIEAGHVALLATASRSQPLLPAAATVPGLHND